MDASTYSGENPPAARGGPRSTASSAGGVLLPLALAQFVASYAASNMNVAINDIAHDLNTTVSGVQTVITFFTLTMAALMIPGSKLTDIWGRKFCLVTGLGVYGLGALIALLAPVLGVLFIGYSILEGVGSALMIPPIYILITVTYQDVTSRARSFGVVSGAAGVGAAAGPLIGGLVTSAISWRASFLLQVLIVGLIIVLSRRIVDAGIQGARPQFDLLGAVLSASGLFFIVFGVLQSRTYGWFGAREAFTIGGTTIIPEGGISPVWLLIAIGALIQLWFFLHIRAREREGKEPLLSTRMFKSRVANLGLVTQNVQWLVLQGTFFVISVFLQTARGYNAIQTGLLLSPAILGILVASGLAQRMATRRTQTNLIRAGFIITIVGMVALVLLAPRTGSPAISFVVGLLLIGFGVGIMLTSSVNVVQSAFPEKDQGEISGLSRSISNLGSSLGTAFVGSVLVARAASNNQEFATALDLMIIFAVIGLVAAFLLPQSRRASERTSSRAS